jgi:iron complex transport system permease protein
VTSNAFTLPAMKEALSLGVPVVALHRRLCWPAALMSAAAVATAGLIGFVGLLAPHLTRLLFGIQCARPESGGGSWAAQRSW